MILVPITPMQVLNEEDDASPGIILIRQTVIKVKERKATGKSPKSCKNGPESKKELRGLSLLVLVSGPARKLGMFGLMGA
jgi:hypothetical protein